MRSAAGKKKMFVKKMEDALDEGPLADELLELREAQRALDALQDALQDGDPF